MLEIHLRKSDILSKDAGHRQCLEKVEHWSKIGLEILAIWNDNMPLLSLSMIDIIVDLWSKAICQEFNNGKKS